MLKANKIAMGIISIVTAFTVSACANDSEKTSPNEEKTPNERLDMDHSDLSHSSSSEVPED